MVSPPFARLLLTVTEATSKVTLLLLLTSGTVNFLSCYLVQSTYRSFLFWYKKQHHHPLLAACFPKRWCHKLLRQLALATGPISCRRCIRAGNGRFIVATQFVSKKSNSLFYPLKSINKYNNDFQKMVCEL